MLVIVDFNALDIKGTWYGSSKLIGMHPKEINSFDKGTLSYASIVGNTAR
jgi:hypothetical protein